ncbi:RHS repeat-associated core domain-containing protein [Xenorhabdus sp. KK7.4]|uniref:RHS repeat-associated core domain-containing protein n=1 Tax=Xenorhabdus sp. KK7.4 TaxID=1851572 RepID=UPI000C039263|nr:RHS repeat-associated core domain-containing protein [Xenorhabdus sp. KK7.4]
MTAMQLWQAGHRPQLTKFRWNSQNQLTGVQTPGGQQWDYRYDAFGRRTEKACEQSGQRTTYLWDGDVPAEIREYRHNRLYSIRHLVFEGWQLLAQQVQFFSLNPENRHELIAGKVQTQYAVCAPTGEPLALFDEAGHRVWRQPPQSLYGLRLGVLGENPELNPSLKFAGQWLDEESGLVYNRHRYYSPVASCYLTPDPIGLAGGEKPYAYVGNPTKAVDPLGLAGCEDPWKIVDRFRRSKNKMEPLGDHIPTPGDNMGTVAFFEMNGRRIFGVNSGTLIKKDKALGKKWNEKIDYLSKDEKGTSAFHAEGHALMRAYEKSGGVMPKEITMYVDRQTCGHCERFLPALMKEMGIEQMKLFSKNGASVVLHAK